MKNASSKPAGISEAFEKDGIWKIPDGSTVKLQDGKYSMESEGFLETGIYTCFVNEDSSYIQFRPDSENNARFSGVYKLSVEESNSPQKKYVLQPCKATGYGIVVQESRPVVLMIPSDN